MTTSLPRFRIYLTEKDAATGKTDGGVFHTISGPNSGVKTSPESSVTGKGVMTEPFSKSAEASMAWVRKE